MNEEEGMDSDEEFLLNENADSDESMDSDESIDSDKSFYSDESIDSDESMESDEGTTSDESEDSDSEDNSAYLRDIPNWISAIQAYVQETNVSRLDLCVPLLSIPFEAVESILKFLPDSCVTELILDEIEFPANKTNFCELLKKTKVEKLSTICCSLSSSETLDVARVLNYTRIKEWNAYILPLDQPDVVKGRELVNCLLHSRLTKLSVNFAGHVDECGALSFVEGLPNTTFTSLCFDYCRKPQRPISNVLLTLFSQLPHCNLTDLELFSQNIDFELIEALSRNLATSNIETLNIKCNYIEDAGLDVLAHGLVGSKVSILNVQGNHILGLNNFGDCLKNTKIKVLNLGNNHISQGKMFAFPNFLKNSMVQDLDISWNRLSDKLLAEFISNLKFSKVSTLNLARSAKFGTQSLFALAAALKYTSLEDINLSEIDLPPEAFDLLNEFIKKSELKCIKLKGPESEQTAVSCLRFIEGTKNSSVLSIDIQHSHFNNSHAELFAGALMNSTFTHLNLRFTKLRDVFTCLAVSLKYTSITHLNISDSGIDDVHVQLLAEYLIGTKIVELNLNNNFITKEGVVALGCCPQTSVVHLSLNGCAVKNEGLEIMAEMFTGSLITTVNVRENPGRRVLIIEKVLLENRTRSLKLVTFFKLVFPENGGGNFCFHLCIQDRDVSDFLDECLQFHKSVLEQPAVISVLLEEESLSFSRKELVDILFDKFPRQFVEFISKWIEADISQHIKLLEQADNLGLTILVENLLLLRPLYTIDETEGIMHPFVYKLLFKYKQLICNVEIEPTGIAKIIKYFTERADIEGATDVIHLLRASKMA